MRWIPRLSSVISNQTLTQKSQIEHPLPLGHLPKRMPTRLQWTALWTLRAELRRLYKRLIPLSYGVRRLRRMYKGATHMLEVGLLAFEGVRQGRVPVTLSKVFAFVCVSVLMWQVLKRRKATAMQDALKDPPVWRAAIQNCSDQATIDFLANELWAITIPQNASSTSTSQTSSGETHPAPAMHLHDTDCDIDYDTGWAHSDFLLSDFQLHVRNILSETALDDGLRFGDFLFAPNLQHASSPSIQPGLGHVPPQHHHPTLGETLLDETGDTESAKIWDPPDPEPWPYTFIDPKLLDLPPTMGSLSHGLLASLAASLLFTAVLEFLYCKIMPPTL